MTGKLPAGLAAMALLGLVAAGVEPAVAQSAEELIESRHVMIRHRLEPAAPVYVGQPVRVWVEVMTRTWFSRAPQYPTAIEVSGAIVIPPAAFGVNSTERIGGETYAVQGRAFTVFPQTTGRFEVPAIPVRLVVARDDASPSPEITLRTDPLTLEARLPAGAEGHGLVLSTPALSVSETYSRSPSDGLRVGDAFKRRVTMTIEDSVAMLLPPMPFEVAEGVTVYPGRPEISDRRNRGRMTGTRVDETTYLMEAEGDYELPEVTIWWWNLGSSSLEQEVLPALSFTVEANPGLAAEHLGEPEAEEAELAQTAAEDDSGPSWQALIGFSVALLLMLYIARRVREWSARSAQRREQEAASEADYIHHFDRIARGGDPSATHAALLRWLDRFVADGEPTTVREFVAQAEDAELAQQYEALDRLLYAPPGEHSPAGTWSSRRFAAAVARGRRKVLDAASARADVPRALPPLNPARKAALGRIR